MLNVTVLFYTQIDFNQMDVDLQTDIIVSTSFRSKASEFGVGLVILYFVQWK